MAMSVNTDRRDPTAPRRPFRATVDLSSTGDGDLFQADAIDLSVGGMAVRSTLLPALGEQLEFHFALGDAKVNALAEVVWASDKGERAGAFGVRFLELPDASQQAIQRHTDILAEMPVSRSKDDSRVQLFIDGMDAPLRARVRVRHPGALVLGSDLSFLKLGEKVHVDSHKDRVEGTIEGVEVEIDPKSRIPRLVLTVDLAGHEAPSTVSKTVRAAVPAAVPVVKTARLPEAREPDAVPAVKPRAPEPPPAQRAPVTAAALDDAETAAEEASVPPPQPVSARSERDAVPSVVSQHDSLDDEEFDDEPAPPTWLTTAMETLRAGMRKASDVGGPAIVKATGVVRGAVVAGGGFVMSKLGRKTAIEAEGANTQKSTLRRQHTATESQSTVDPKVKRRRALMLVAAVLVLGVTIVAFASLGGPSTTTPTPQVAVAPADPMAVAAAELPAPADPNAAQPADPNAAQPEPAEAADPNAGQPGVARPARRTLPPDLAAAAPGASRMAEERPVLQNAPARPLRRVAPAVAPVAAARAVAPAAAPARPAVFGNPAVRTGTVLQLRMDGPVAQLGGVGARGAAIVINIPGRHSLDVAAPLVRQDPRLVGAGIFNRSTGAELTLRFREPAPSFVARARGNTLEIVLAPTPGAPRPRVVQAANNPEGPQITTHPNGIGVVQHVARR